MNILTITTLYPNQKQFRHGIFIETRLRYLLKSGKLTAKVIAPVPWFPFRHNYFKQYAIYADIPKFERHNGIDVYHPRYLVIPKVGMLFTPFFMAFSLFLQIKKMQKEETFDLVDAHYYYPDGIAVALISKVLNIPFLISARGTDINLISDYFLPKKMILWAANLASGSITVSQALKDKMIEIGADQDKIHVLRNGIDLDLFKILNKEECKKKYGLTQKVLLSVGNLIELKGHHLIIEAMQQLEGFQLIIVGKGDREKKLKLLVNKLNLNDRVTFLGEKKQPELVEIYNASDAFVLASSREGMANVLLESIACGTPVIATDVGGASEVVKQKEAGVLINRSVEEIVQGVRILFDDYPKSKETRNYAEQFSWDSTVEGLEKLFGKSIL